VQEIHQAGGADTVIICEKHFQKRTKEAPETQKETLELACLQSAVDMIAAAKATAKLVPFLPTLL
jgi:hypothetical protein